MATTTESQEILDQRDQFLDEEVQPASGGGSGRLLAALVLLTALIGGGLYAASQFGTGDSTPSLTDASMLFEVQPADLMVTVTEDGNVESANNVDVKCRVAGGSTILWIVKDGTEVKQGDKIVELDASTLEDQINTQKIAYNKAKATVVTAEKNFEVAKLAVREYLEGTYKQELETAEAQITIAEENLRSAKNALDYSQRMFQRGYISQLELEGQEFTVKRAELELSAANTAKNVLIEFTKVKMMEDLQSQVATTESTLQSERAAYDLEEAKLERLQQQVEFCTIVAPQDGMVVFANDQGGGRFGGGQQSVTIEEGAAVRDRQTLLRLPDLTRMQVNVKVHETKVEQIKIGMRARITIQGRQYQGAVTAIANQHEATSFFSGNVKEYATTVRIDGEVTNLRPGMTAEAEILIDHLKSVLTVPVSAVVEKRGEYLCWVAGNGKDYERRALVMGKSDDNYVEIKDGLKAGDRVIRNPRSFVAEATAMVTEDEEINVNDQFGEPTGSGSMGAGRGGPGPGAPGADGPGAGRPEGAGPGGPGAGGPGGGPGGGFGGPGGPGAGGPAGGPGGGGPAGGGRGMGNLMDLDLDKDGKVSRDEAPEPMQNFFDRLDGNSDGFIDQQEADAMRRRFEQGGGRPGPPGGGPDGAPGGTQ